MSSSQSDSEARRSHGSQRANNALPLSFAPGSRDVICGRARENFHHDGNCYFRDLVSRSIGPYLTARTKQEKSDVIMSIIDQVNVGSPSGGFVKRETRTGRWYKINDSEARDKVGHAVRKASQRLEESQPKLAKRMKTQVAATTQSCKSEQTSLSSTKSESSLSPSPQDDSGDHISNNNPAASKSMMQDSQSGTKKIPASSQISSITQQTDPLLASLLAPATRSSQASLLAGDMFSHRPTLPHTIGLSASQLASQRLLSPTSVLSSILPREQTLQVSNANVRYPVELTGLAGFRQDIALLDIVQRREGERLQELAYARRLAMMTSNADNHFSSVFARGSLSQPAHSALEQILQSPTLRLACASLPCSEWSGTANEGSDRRNSASLDSRDRESVLSKKRRN